MQTSWLSRFDKRRVQAEVMDQPGLPAAEHRHALRSLARINWFSRSSQLMAGPIESLARKHHPLPLRVLDLACGGGDVVVSLAHRFIARGLAIQWAGCDLSPVAVAHSREHADRVGVRVEFFQCDVLAERIAANFDVVMCSLFLHHLTDDAAGVLLEKMRQAAGKTVLVNDLVRSTAGYILAQVACRFLTRSSVVHNDGPLSVANAFTVSEMQRLAIEAGLCGARISRHWPNRMLLEWRK